MYKLLILSFICCLLLGCKSTYHGSQNKCQNIGFVAGQITAMKWSLRRGNFSAEDWRRLTYERYDDLSKYGLSLIEADEFTGEIFENDIFPNDWQDVVAFEFYKKRKCSLLEMGAEIKPLNIIKKSMQACWTNLDKIPKRCLINAI